MTITLTNAVFDNIALIDAISNLHKQRTIPVTLSYKINLFWKELQRFNFDFQDIKTQISGKYGKSKKDIGESGYHFSKDNFEKFKIELQELYDIKIKFISEVIEAHPNFKMSGEDIEVLENIIVDFTVLQG